MKKLFIFTMTIALSFILYSSNVSALEKVPDEVLSAAKASIGDFKVSLERQRDIFGLSTEDDIENNLTLGEGYLCYKILAPAVEKLKATKTTLSSNEIISPIDSYVFPVKVGDKCAGLATVEKSNGEWKVIQVSNDLSFESDMENAMKQINDKAPGASENAKFIYDLGADLVGLSIKNAEGDYFIPTRDSRNNNYKKGEKQSFSKISSSISNGLKNKDSSLESGAGFTYDDKNSFWGKTGIFSSYYTYIALFSWAALFCGIIYYRKRMPKSVN